MLIGRIWIGSVAADRSTRNSELDVERCGGIAPQSGALCCAVARFQDDGLNGSIAIKYNRFNALLRKGERRTIFTPELRECGCFIAMVATRCSVKAENKHSLFRFPVIEYRKLQGRAWPYHYFFPIEMSTSHHPF